VLGRSSFVWHVSPSHVSRWSLVVAPSPSLSSSQPQRRVSVLIIALSICIWQSRTQAGSVNGQVSSFLETELRIQ
jgi:hypothetical protein